MTRIVEGWTEPLSYTLQADGAVIDLTNRTVSIYLYDASGIRTTPAGAVTVVDAVHGKISFTPADGDLLASRSPYRVRFKVSPDGYFVPNSETPEEWIVSKP